MSSASCWCSWWKSRRGVACSDPCHQTKLWWNDCSPLWVPICSCDLCPLSIIYSSRGSRRILCPQRAATNPCATKSDCPCLSWHCQTFWIWWASFDSNLWCQTLRCSLITIYWMIAKTSCCNLWAWSSCLPSQHSLMVWSPSGCSYSCNSWVQPLGHTGTLGPYGDRAIWSLRSKPDQSKWRNWRSQKQLQKSYHLSRDHFRRTDSPDSHRCRRLLIFILISLGGVCAQSCSWIHSNWNFAFCFHFSLFWRVVWSARFSLCKISFLERRVSSVGSQTWRRCRCDAYCTSRDTL